MPLEIALLTRSPAGVRQTSEQWAEAPHLHLVVDALSLAGERHAEQLAQRAEGLLRAAFDGRDVQTIDEPFCTQAFRQVHRDLMADTELDAIGVAVSALVMVYTPHVSGEGRLLVAGVGDCRLYQVDAGGLRCLFADPHGRAALPGASADERLTQLRHALCRQPALQVACHRIQVPAEMRLAAASWSLYAHNSEEELAQRLGRRGRESELASWIAQQPQNGHSIRLALVTRAAAPDPATAAQAGDAGRRRRQQRWALGLAAAACALVAVVATEAWPRTNKAPGEQLAVVRAPVTALPAESEGLAPDIAETVEFLPTAADDRIADVGSEQLESALRERSELARAVERMQDELRDRDTQLSKMAKERATWLQEMQDEGALAEASGRDALEARLNERERQVTALQDQLANLVTLLDTKEQLLEQVRGQAESASLFEEGYQREQRLREQLTDQLSQLKTELGKQRQLLSQIDASTAQEAAAQRVHKVAPGETLTAIAQKYYGTSKRWREIYEANRTALPSQNTLRPGITLVIP